MDAAAQPARPDPGPVRGACSAGAEAGRGEAGRHGGAQAEPWRELARCAGALVQDEPSPGRELGDAAAWGPAVARAGSGSAWEQAAWAQDGERDPALQEPLPVHWRPEPWPRRR